MMNDPTKIASYQQIVPMIYAYNTPGITYHDGWTKIGQTEKGVVKRIRQQTHTAWVEYVLAWSDNAMYKDGSGQYFTDHDFHRFLQCEKEIERNDHTEWFHIDHEKALQYFFEFAMRQHKQTETGSTYTLRKEQDQAVQMTLDYLKENNGKGKFLWNAKPRFGKTLSSYELIQRMKARNVLIVTNRPSIANSWYDDYVKFIGWQTGYKFVTDNEALRGKKGVMTRSMFMDWLRIQDASSKANIGQICFESLQGLKGSVFFGGTYNKLEWIKNLKWDVLIIDESHEGVDTMRTDRAFDNIQRRFTLYLSGTPFKAIASSEFSEKQIFNWSYTDEQESKKQWTDPSFNPDHYLDHNPYEDMPRLNLFTFKMSDIVRDQVMQGIDLSDDDDANTEYAFDLNEFFCTNEQGRFVYEDDVRKFVHALTTQKKFPFSTEELRKQMAHTLWLLKWVDSAKALAKILKEPDSGFSDYEIVIAAGDGRLNDEVETVRAYNRVKDAIAHHDKTITLSVGQLTTGVTIPEWSGVLMLSNMKSATLYMQAAFRAQNPCDITRDGKRWRKENAYVFDFDPARTLVLFDEFANNLRKSTAGGGGTSEERATNIRQLLNFFPVIAEDENGEMIQIDERQVLSIPRRIKCQEVVRRGFMSNFLFKNISNIFGAPSIVRDILNKMDKAREERGHNGKGSLDDADNVDVDDNGEVQVPNEVVIGQEKKIFGNKPLKTLNELHTANDNLLQDSKPSEVSRNIDKIGSHIKDAVKETIIKPASEANDLTQSQTHKLEKQIEKDVDTKIEKIKGDYEQHRKIAEVKRQEAMKQADTEASAKAADTAYKEDMRQAMQDLMDSVKKVTEDTINNKPHEVVERIEVDKANREKKSVEDEVRAHLRGFSRTIPSFIMAYDNGQLSLNNFDKNIEDDVFQEVTSITLDEFRFLRDGGDYVDEETGKSRHFNGQLFDEVVFDDSINEFRRKRHDLADYFDESQKEDIFDYIPPQRTNQIYTPKAMVKKMVDLLEEENPGIFDDPDKTYCDLYMKSGLYITEIVKRLYNNEHIKQLYPDNKERIYHIMRKQVYGFAPSRIIYLIATHFILGFDENFKPEYSNFRQIDTVPWAKDGKIDELIEKEFGK